MKMKKTFVALVMLVMLGLVHGCSSSPKEIPFESVLKRGTSNWQEHGTNLAILSKKKDMVPLMTPSPEAVVQTHTMYLDNIDLSTHFGVIVFQGVKGTGGYDVEIQNIRQLDRTVEVHVRFFQPKPMEYQTLAVYSPYHLVHIKRADLSKKGRLTFILIDDISGEEVAKVIHTVW